ncbi:MAG: 2-oxoacid:acceptor oxidoreductase family protein [Candidatus Moranbacteria bacterium]|nr:2-oxoacid:acceptor oxidoreductase family protein [Candidatus Moranbacteria bacterium]
MKTDKKIFEIIFHARGGQGAKTAAELLAQAALREGKHIQAFPDFGPERTGAPIRTYVRVSGEPIKTHEPVVDPDLVVVMDETLLGIVDVSKNLDENEMLIVNTRSGRDEISQKTGYVGNIFPIDATSLSLEVIGEPRPNTAILGKLLKISEVVRLESLTEVFREKYLEKIGNEKTEKNILAIEKAYDSI